MAAAYAASRAAPIPFSNGAAPVRPGARAAAAIEILADLGQRRRPAADAVKDWMLTHRFAGAKDRAAIGDLVFGALRWKASSAYRFGEDTPRAWVLGALRWGFAALAETIERDCYEPHAPPPPTEQERAVLAEATPASRLEGAPAWVCGDYPEWLEAQFALAFGDQRAKEGAALAAPAPLDLRANRLVTTREALAAQLGQSKALDGPPEPTPLAPDGLRLPWRPGRSFPWAAEPSFLDGGFEVQDEGSQLAALLTGAAPGLQLGDVCAGGGGKSLACAALMANSGQIYAHDIDGKRLAPLKARAERAGVRNLQIRFPRRDGAELADLVGRLDVALVDAPCTGSGTWRRNPDAKWRVRPGALEKRQAEQQEALRLAAPLVRPGGRLVYVTCSVLPAENDAAVAEFLRANPGFTPRAPATAARAALPPELAARLLDRAWIQRHGLQLSPARTGCDGFYAAVLVREA